MYILYIVESWLSGDISDDEISLSGYSIVRLDRNRHGGGILIYILSNCTTVPPLANSDHLGI